MRVGVRGREGLFAEYGFASRRSGDGDLGVGARRRADVDDVDVVAFDKPTPVSLPLVDPVGGGGRGDRRRVATRYDLDDWPKTSGSHQRRDAVAVTVRPSHGAVSAEPDAKLRRGHRPGPKPPPPARGIAPGAGARRPRPFP